MNLKAFIVKYSIQINLSLSFFKNNFFCIRNGSFHIENGSFRMEKILNYVNFKILRSTFPSPIPPKALKKISLTINQKN